VHKFHQATLDWFRLTRSQVPSRRRTARPLSPSPVPQTDPFTIPCPAAPGPNLLDIDDASSTWPPSRSALLNRLIHSPLLSQVLKTHRLHSSPDFHGSSLRSSWARYPIDTPLCWPRPHCSAVCLVLRLPITWCGVGSSSRLSTQRLCPSLTLSASASPSQPSATP